MNFDGIFKTVKECCTRAENLSLYLNGEGVLILNFKNTHFRVSVTTPYELSLGFPVDRNEGTNAIVEMAIYHGDEMVSMQELGYDEFQYFENPEYSDILFEIRRISDALRVDNQCLDEVVGPDIDEHEIEIPTNVPSIYSVWSTFSGAWN